MGSASESPSAKSGVGCRPVFVRWLACSALIFLGALAASHASAAVSASCPAVLPGWDSPQTGRPVAWMENTIRLKGQVIFWNGTKISETTLKQYVREAKTLNPIPFLVFDPTLAKDCNYAERIRDLINRAGCNQGGCGQGSLAAFSHAPFKHYSGGIP